VRFSAELLEEIRQRCNIVEIVSEYVHLKPAGKGFKGLCPFHNEKTPSFMVSPEKQLYHCFGCGEGGNVFNLVMKLEKVEFLEAIEMLAKRAGITLPADNREENRLNNQKERLYRINNFASQYYQQCLTRSTKGQKIIEYLKKRGINSETIGKYQLGYAPAGSDFLTVFLKKRNYHYPEIIKAGLARRGRNGSGYIDYFRNRIIFPIFNIRGDIAGFGGRVVDDTLPKYINSPETLVYHKGENLYNLNFAREEIRKKNLAIIVEGYTDVLIAQQYGFKNTVASLGTALTVQQVELIKRFADRVVIAYDADLAGNMAALRSLDLFIQVGLETKVLTLPPEYDPAEYLIKKGAPAFQRLINVALSLIDYRLKLLYKKYEINSIEGKVKIVSEILPTLSMIKNEVELREQVKKIADELSLSEEAILIELRKFSKGIKFSDQSGEASFESGNLVAEKIIIGAILVNEKIAPELIEKIEEEDFSLLLHRQIIKIIRNLFKAGKKIEAQKVIDYLNDARAARLIAQILMEEEIILDRKVILGCVETIKNYRLNQEIKELERRAKILDEKIKQSEKIENNDLKELEKISQQLKMRNIK